MPDQREWLRGSTTLVSLSFPQLQTVVTATIHSLDIGLPHKTELFGSGLGGADIAAKRRVA